jgi:hypothetical protein
LAPGRPHVLRGGQVDLQLGLREDDRADVAALDHAAAVLLGPLSLAVAQLGPHPRVGGHDADGARDLRTTDLDGGVHAVDGDRGVDHVQVEVLGQRADDVDLVRVDHPAQRREGDRPVHGPGVQVVEVEPAGEGPGHGRLPRTSRTVDGYDSHGRTPTGA